MKKGKASDRITPDTTTINGATNINLFNRRNKEDIAPIKIIENPSTSLKE
jgi:hypothetical protein